MKTLNLKQAIQISGGVSSDALNVSSALAGAALSNGVTFTLLKVTNIIDNPYTASKRIPLSLLTSFSGAFIGYKISESIQNYFS